MTTLAALAAGQHPDPITLALLGFAAVAGYAISLYLRPVGRCPRCHGNRVTKTSTSRRLTICRRCSGTGQTRRTGATAVHRFYWSVLGDHRREHRRQQHRRTRDPAGRPGP